MKQFLLIFCSVLICLTLVACGAARTPHDNGTDSQDVEIPSETDLKVDPKKTDKPKVLDGEDGDIPEGEGTLIETEYGSYVLPDGWYKFDEISTPEKTFYLKEGIPFESVISNISVECGKNRYAKDDHLRFRTALVQQLGTQAADMDLQMTAVGSYTKADDILYIFTLSDDDFSTIQYYIVGDKRYVLIHVTDMMDEQIPDVNDIAATIANSFVWS